MIMERNAVVEKQLPVLQNIYTAISFTVVFQFWFSIVLV